MIQLITKEAFSTICAILQEKEGLDQLDIVEFAMEVEKRLQITIPNDWFVPGCVATMRKQIEK